MSHIEQTHYLVHTFSNRHVCSWRHFLAYLYSHFSHFSDITKKKTILHSPQFITVIFVQLFCKWSSSGSSDPYHFGGTRSVLSWETIVHYPRCKLRGQIRFKDTTLSLSSDLLSNYCLYCRQGKKIGFFGRYFAEKSVFGRHREEKSEEKAIIGKIWEKSVKSPIFRRKIGKN